MTPGPESPWSPSARLTEQRSWSINLGSKFDLLGLSSAGRARRWRIAAIAAGRKAIDVRVIDLRGIVNYTDFLVICSGNTERQAKAIHDAVYEELKHADGLLPRRTEGEREARWILLDYLDCVVHIFTPDARAYYRLEQLWGEAPARSVG